LELGPDAIPGLHHPAACRRTLSAAAGTRSPAALPYASKREPSACARVWHKIKLKPGTRVFDGGALTLAEPDGREFTVDIQPRRVLFMAGAGYAYTGGWRDGQYHGPLVVEGERWDLTDPSAVERVHVQTETVCEYRVGDQVGYGPFELICLGVYEPCGFKSPSTSQVADGRPTLPPHIEALLSPEAYPHPVKSIELRQTHISYVLIAGDVVYKLKKPFDFGFLDYTTLEKRKRFCEEEVRLNRRLCEGTYLGVEPVVSKGDDTRIGGEGEVIDYAVKMRRLPEEGMMSHLLERDAITPAMLSALAERIAAFHQSSERSEEIDSYGGMRRRRSTGGDRADRAYIGRTSACAVRRHHAFVEHLEFDEDPFAQRVREGARDCHGDMRTDAVCFEDRRLHLRLHRVQRALPPGRRGGYRVGDDLSSAAGATFDEPWAVISRHARCDIAAGATVLQVLPGVRPR
jgi:hypothetical protein